MEAELRYMKVTGGASTEEANKYHVVHTTDSAGGEQEGGEVNRLLYGQVRPSYFTDAESKPAVVDNTL